MSSGFTPEQPGQFGQPDPAAQFPPSAQGQYPSFPPGKYGQPASPQFQQQYMVAPRRTNALAIAALCCGIGQILAGPFAGLPAIILGAISMKQIRETGEDGRGMALAGLILGIVGLVFTLLVLVFIAFIIHHVATTAP
jgi:hypothetical protein